MKIYTVQSINLLGDPIGLRSFNTKLEAENYMNKTKRIVTDFLKYYDKMYNYYKGTFTRDHIKYKKDYDFTWSIIDNRETWIREKIGIDFYIVESEY